MTNTDVALGLALTMLVIGILGAWFYGCGRADREREVRAYAQNTLLYAGAGFAIGIAFLTTDLSPSQPEERMAFVALTVGSFLLLYAAVSAIVASDDNALAIVNLTGRALLLTDPQLAPFYTLPAPQAEPAASLPPVRPRTFYIVSAELARIGAEAGRTDLYTIDATTTSDPGANGPLRVRRLLRAAPADARSDTPAGTTGL